MYGVYGLFSELLEEEIRGWERSSRVRIWKFCWPCQCCGLRMKPQSSGCSAYTTTTTALFWHKTSLTDKTVTDTLRYIGRTGGLSSTGWKPAFRAKRRSSLEEFVMIDSTQPPPPTYWTSMLRGTIPQRTLMSRYGDVHVLFRAEATCLLYRLINRNIPDVSSMRLCVEKWALGMSYLSPTKGFTKSNIKTLSDNGFYIYRSTGTTNW